MPHQILKPGYGPAHRHSPQSFALILLHRDPFDSGIVRKCALHQNKNTGVITHKNAGNFPYSQNFGAPQQSGAIGLSLFSLTVKPRLVRPLLETSANLSLVQKLLAFWHELELQIRL